MRARHHYPLYTYNRTNLACTCDRVSRSAQGRRSRELCEACQPGSPIPYAIITPLPDVMVPPSCWVPACVELPPYVQHPHPATYRGGVYDGSRAGHLAGYHAGNAQPTVRHGCRD